MDSRDYLGLRFEAFPTGAGSWFYRYRSVDGHYQYEKLGEWPEMSLKAARVGRDAMAERIRKGGPRDAVTWYRALQDYLGAVSEEGRDGYIRSWRERKRSLEFDTGDWFERPAEEITRDDVRSLMNVMVARGATTQARRVFAYGRKVFNWLIESGGYGIDFSPFDRLKPPGKEHARDEWLRPDQIRRVLKNGPESLSAPAMAVIEIALRTGQRIGEVAGMHAEELALDDGWWHLPGARTKNGRAHDVPLPPQAVAVIRGQLRDGAGHVFPGKGRAHLQTASVDEAWAQARGGLKLRSIRPHDFRHTVMTQLAKLGVSKTVRERIANHRARQSVSDRYDHHGYDEEARAALERWNDEIDEWARRR